MASIYLIWFNIFLCILHILSTLKFLCEVSCTVESYALFLSHLEIWKETNGKIQAWRAENLRNPGLGAAMNALLANQTWE